MSAYLGDFRIGKTVRKLWNSNAVAGESITRATNGTISVYKDGGTTQSTAGVTDTEDFDGLTGVHLVAVDTAADGTFYSAGSDFEVVLSGATIDGKAINATLFAFSLENRSALMPTTDGRKLDVSAGGEAGVDWANVGTPGSTVNLSATTVKTATDVETDTADIQSRLPATLSSGRIRADAEALSGDSTAADNLELCLDGGGGVLFADLAGKVLGGGSGVLGGVGVRADARQINGDADAAARLALSAKQIVPGTIDTAAFTPTTTEFEADDVTEATADHYVGRVIIFTSGALLAQATAIRDYVLSGGRGRFTVSAMTEAPANNDTFVIV